MDLVAVRNIQESVYNVVKSLLLLPISLPVKNIALQSVEINQKRKQEYVQYATKSFFQTHFVTKSVQMNADVSRARKHLKTVVRLKFALFATKSLLLSTALRSIVVINIKKSV
jgi:hypothetical protein